jgi:hypothetical protein
VLAGGVLEVSYRRLLALTSSSHKPDEWLAPSEKDTGAHYHGACETKRVARYTLRIVLRSGSHLDRSSLRARSECLDAGSEEVAAKAVPSLSAVTRTLQPPLPSLNEVVAAS